MAIHAPSRRAIVRAGVGLGALLAGAEAAAAVFADAPVRRVAFGSCAHQDKDQPIWDAVLAAQPDLFIFLGDNVYGDTRDPAVLSAQYAKLAAKPGFKRLRDTVPILAVWDDHDYGENDVGVEYPIKAQSRALFCDFWGEPADSPRRTQDGGVHTALTLGPDGQRLQVILPDLRWNRTPLTSTSSGYAEYYAWAIGRRLRGLSVPGPYRPNTADGSTMIGDAQWAWLEAQLRAPAEVRLFGSSLQVLSEGTGWEAWEYFPADQKRFLDALDRASVRNLVCLSGDVHYGEITKLDRSGAPPLWELTSSGLTQVMPVLPPNGRRVGKALRARNFGLIDIEWSAAPRLNLQVCDERGGVRVAQDVRFDV